MCDQFLTSTSYNFWQGLQIVLDLEKVNNSILYVNTETLRLDWEKHLTLQALQRNKS